MGNREDSSTGMEPWNAMGMGSHACVSSNPAGGGACSFFFLSLLSLLLLLSCPSPAEPISLFPLFFSCSTCRSLGSVRCQSENSSFCLRPSCSFPTFVCSFVSSRFAFGFRLPPLNNCPPRGKMRRGLEHGGRPRRARDREMHRPAMNPSSTNTWIFRSSAGPVIITTWNFRDFLNRCLKSRSSLSVGKRYVDLVCAIKWIL